jgi:hypothetical protein
MDGVGIGRRVVTHHQSAAFQKERAAAVDEDALAHHMRRHLEGGIGVADGDGHAGGNVGFCVEMRARTAGFHRGGAVRDAWKRFIIDLHQGGRILGDISAVGHDDGDRFAGIDGLGARERIGQVEFADRGAGHEQRQRVPAQRLRQVGEGEHEMHAGERSRRVSADAEDFRMRIGAAHEGRMKRSRQAQIVDEAALAGEQRRILLALDRGPEPLRSHGMLCPLCPRYLTWRKHY